MSETMNTNQDTPTPRTDEIIELYQARAAMVWELKPMIQSIERELTAARDGLKASESAIKIHAEAYARCEIRNQKLTEQRDEARRVAKKWRDRWLDGACPKINRGKLPWENQPTNQNDE